MCLYFKFRDAFLILALHCHFISTQVNNPSFYLDPNNNYDNYNNDYSFNFDSSDSDSEENTIESDTEGDTEADTESDSESNEYETSRAQFQMLKGPGSTNTEKRSSDDSCWMTLNAAGHFKSMDELDDQFKEVRENYQNNVGEKMDKQMLDELLGSGGAAPRAVHNFGGNSLLVPAGLNLGGYCMVRQKDSVLFFHRMKLRNSTHFQVQFLHNDLENMVLLGMIGLNDLHLTGTYERSATHTDPSVLYYRPSYGTVEVLLKNVDYKMEGRLRMLSDRFTIELINSELVIKDDILLSYLNTNLTSQPEYTVKMQTKNLDEFLQRLKTDLDLWMKDFFNDFFMYFDLPEYDHTQFQEYNKKKTIYLNEYVNYAVNTIRQQVYNVVGTGVRLPKFTLFSVPNMILKISDGVLRGLDTMHRRSVATGGKFNDVRAVDVIVGFSKLRAEYKLEAVLPNGAPPLTGSLVLTSDELTAHLGISLVSTPDSLDVSFDFIQHMKPESLIVEGPVNRLIGNFKHQLEHHIISLMSNALMHNIKMLNSITRCVPYMYGYQKEDPNYITQDDTDPNNKLRSAKKPKTKKRPDRRNKLWKAPLKNKKSFLKNNKKNYKQ